MAIQSSDTTVDHRPDRTVGGRSPVPAYALDGHQEERDDVKTAREGRPSREEARP
jgi:hypothetical protein